MENRSELVLVLHGLNESVTERRVYFALGLAAYALTVAVNLTLVVTVCLEKSLHQPLYIFVCNLCVNGIWGASSFYPKLLLDLLAEAHVVPYSGCLAQIFVVYSYAFCEFTSLTVMAYDRFLAICRPLRYRALMSPGRASRLLLLTWSFSLLESSLGIALTARLPLCGRHIQKMLCTNWEVVKLSCSSTTLNNVYGFALMVSHVSQTGLILVSYVHLVRASLRSRADRRRFVQTCLPHLATLLVFTGSQVFDAMYARYGGGSLRLQNALAAEFLVLPPLVNPLVYGINLQHLRAKVLHHLSPRPQTLRPQDPNLNQKPDLIKKRLNLSHLPPEVKRSEGER